MISLDAINSGSRRDGRIGRGSDSLFFLTFLSVHFFFVLLDLREEGSIPLEDTIAVISCTIIFICPLSCSNSPIICVNSDWSGAAASSEPALSSRICLMDFLFLFVLPLLICPKHSRHNRGCPTPDSSLVCPLIEGCRNRQQ